VALFCKKNMSPLQRNSVRWMGVALLLTVAANIFTVGPNPVQKLWPFLSVLAVSPGHAPVWKTITATFVMLFPVLLAVFVASRYLAHEPDEFIRALITRAVLWGIASTMVADAVAGELMAASGETLPIALMNADVFFIATGFSFRLLLRRYSR
jgi:hypothetical protein